MVTASKVAAAAANGSDPRQSLREDEERSSAGSYGGSHGSEAYELPLSFGEQLVLETYIRCRARRYDRKRQEELSQPRRQKAAKEFLCKMPSAGGSEESSRAPLDKSQVEDLVSRLSAPKKSSHQLAAGASIAMHASQAEVSKARPVVDEAVWARLAAPKPGRPNDPTPGERVCMMYHNFSTGRGVNFERLADMAKPKKRGGSCASWGIHPNRTTGALSARDSTSRDSMSLPPAPDSARGWRSGGGGFSAIDISSPPPTSAVERLPEVVDNSRAAASWGGRWQEDADDGANEYSDNYEDESPASRPGTAGQQADPHPLADRPNYSYDSGKSRGKGDNSAMQAAWNKISADVEEAEDEENSDEGVEPFFPQFGLKRSS
ncbi:unnamed protein product [Polarella glacialis]|uniref:Uncharacterized protein n=1 Tax=Polarella glacialis TaxID=89957 RepID=A0A813GEK4_POLGL|nr:unnamed protein product [Polarella glacialis]|mmetsp:Transcript_4059/g.7838  ORF Transcript_4059/g.7838 Transcript_4059/m.7838 type:complete len:377 (-) Transcript_4059:210-1340(-)